jgi:DNA-binding response OmpR family regulator
MPEEAAPVRARVLVIEPDPDLFTLIRLVLCGAGYGVAVAEALDAAVYRVLSPGPLPTRVVLDLPALPADALAVCRAAKARWPAFPLLVLVNDPTATFREACQAAGADAVVPKPLDPDGFTAVVERVFTAGPGGPSILVQ